jgi:hypothetical protein
MQTAGSPLTFSPLQTTNTQSRGPNQTSALRLRGSPRWPPRSIGSTRANAPVTSRTKVLLPSNVQKLGILSVDTDCHQPSTEAVSLRRPTSWCLHALWPHMHMMVHLYKAGEVDGPLDRERDVQKPPVRSIKMRKQEEAGCDGSRRDRATLQFLQECS